MSTSQNNDNCKKCVGVAWWHPEEIPWLSRSRNIMPTSQNNDNLKNGVGVAWWHPEEIPWLSRSRSIMPFPKKIIKEMV